MKKEKEERKLMKQREKEKKQKLKDKTLREKKKKSFEQFNALSERPESLDVQDTFDSEEDAICPYTNTTWWQQ